MSNWTAVITNDGAKELNGLLDCKTLAFTDARGCAGKVMEAALTAQVALDGWTQKATITEVKRGDSEVTVKLRFGAADTAYTLHRIGIWVKVGSGEPVMVAIHQHQGFGIAVPSKAESPNFSYVYYAGMAIQNGKLVSLTIDPLATQGLESDAEKAAVSAAASAASAENAQAGAEAAKTGAETAQAAAQGYAQQVQEGLAVVAGTKKADLIGDASLMYQLEPGQRLIITTGEAVVGITDAELEALAAYVDSLVDGEDETGGDAGGDA